ncbi:tetratricopeptide repeat protein [bacterium]|nr:tetratricopeptide repeat protein [bacterium]MDG1891476.1 tetratricopeptide repeat protein [Verrucomicrobiota bacterium]
MHSYFEKEDVENADKLLCRERFAALLESCRISESLGKGELAAYYRGLAWEGLHSMEQAQSCLHRCLELNPKNDLAWGHLARICFEEHQYERAFQCAQQAHRLNPQRLSNSVLWSKVLRNRQQLYEAERVLQEHASEPCDDPSYTEARIETFLAQGLLEEAQKCSRTSAYFQDLYRPFFARRKQFHAVDEYFCSLCHATWPGQIMKQPDLDTTLTIFHLESFYIPLSFRRSFCVYCSQFVKGIDLKQTLRQKVPASYSELARLIHRSVRFKRKQGAMFGNIIKNLSGIKNIEGGDFKHIPKPLWKTHPRISGLLQDVIQGKELEHYCFQCQHKNALVEIEESTTMDFITRTGSRHQDIVEPGGIQCSGYIQRKNQCAYWQKPDYKNLPVANVKAEHAGYVQFQYTLLDCDFQTHGPHDVFVDTRQKGMKTRSTAQVLPLSLPRI